MGWCRGCCRGNVGSFWSDCEKPTSLVHAPKHRQRVGMESDGGGSLILTPVLLAVLVNSQRCKKRLVKLHFATGVAGVVDWIATCEWLSVSKDLGGVAKRFALLKAGKFK